MPATTACLACRALKAKCLRNEGANRCVRCSRLGIGCETVPRQLGRRLGSKNRPKSSSGPPPTPSLSPSSSRNRHSLAAPEHERRSYREQDRTERPGGRSSSPTLRRMSYAESYPRAHPDHLHKRHHDDESEQLHVEIPISRITSPIPGNTGGVPYSNMLNVLAKVADEMPPSTQETSIPTPIRLRAASLQSTIHSQVGSSPEVDMSSNPHSNPNSKLDATAYTNANAYAETGAYPFDRRKFLTMYRQASRNLDPDPYMGMAVLEQGLDQLFDPDNDDKTKILPGEEIVYARIDRPRRDLLPEWDVLSSGLLSETEVEELLEVYWNRCNPITRILDPSMYTLAFIRTTSCLLLAVMLQVSAQCLPVSRHSASLVSRLDNHIDHLLAEITRRGLQSLAICQALVIYTTWLKAEKQSQTWQFISQAIGMAHELRMDAVPTPMWLTSETVQNHISPIKRRRSVQRFWIILSDWDRRLAFIRGRRQLMRENALTSKSSLRTWWSESEALDCDVMTCATLNFRIPMNYLQQEIQRTMVARRPFKFEDHLANVDEEISSWRSEWYHLLGKPDQQRAEHDIRANRLILLMIPYDHRLGTERIPIFARDECLIAALDVCKNAIPLLGGVQPGLPVHNVTAARLYLLGYTSLCALRIMGLSTPEDDRRNVDDELFHLSILSALASRLCNLNVHRNVALIASVLGRRLLEACRLVTARLLAPESPNQTKSQKQFETRNEYSNVNTGAFISANLTHSHPDGRARERGTADMALLNHNEDEEMTGTAGHMTWETGGTGYTDLAIPQDLNFGLDFGLFPLGDLFPLFDGGRNGVSIGVEVETGTGNEHGTEDG